MKGYRNTLELHKSNLGNSPSDKINLVMITGMINGVNESLKQAEERL